MQATKSVFVNIDQTNFIFSTNFSGDPSRDRFNSPKRKVNVIIPTKEQADEIAALGVNVKVTRPNPNRTYDGEYIPKYYVKVGINMDLTKPPKIVWVTPTGAKVECTKENVGNLDYIRVKNVNCMAKVVKKKNVPGYSLYAHVMYVEQSVDYDPYAHLYADVPSTDWDLD